MDATATKKTEHALGQNTNKSATYRCHNFVRFKDLTKTTHKARHEVSWDTPSPRVDLTLYWEEHLRDQKKRAPSQKSAASTLCRSGTNRTSSNGKRFERLWRSSATSGTQNLFAVEERVLAPGGVNHKRRRPSVYVTFDNLIDPNLDPRYGALQSSGT